jgi:competence protein ComEC
MATGHSIRHMRGTLHALVVLSISLAVFTPNSTRADTAIGPYAGAVEVGRRTDLTLRVSFIDVGEGDSALLQDSAGCNILIDGGRPEYGATVVAYLHAQGVSKLDAVIATHADSDHVGGLAGVIRTADISVTRVLYNGYGGPSSNAWNDFVDAVVSRGLTLTLAGWPATFAWCATTAQVLNPNPLVPFSNDNDDSVVLLVEHGTTRYLFTGDISSDVDTNVIARTAVLPIDVLKVSHHGSTYASSAGFLAATRPGTAVISVGPNTYGHPTTQTLQRLGNIGAQVVRTDLSGTITLQDTAFAHVAFLPLVVAPANNPMPGYQVQCNGGGNPRGSDPHGGNSQMCASISNPTPAQSTNLTVRGRLLVNNMPQAGVPMTATWFYKSTASSCSGISGNDGLAECSRAIGKAAIGYTVIVAVTMGGYTTTTNFMPQ